MPKAKKFGALAGVYTPSLLTILGVIMYMRLGWVVGHAGLWGTIFIILIAHVISITTGLSVASIATDKKIEAGGIYYMLSRSLGLPMGGAIGITLFLATALSIALYLVGFSESINAYLNLGTTVNDYRLTGSIALVAIAIIAFISTSIALKTQFFILGAIALSLISIFFGTQSYAPETVKPFLDDSSVPLELIFAIFFPAVTGFTAGVAMSGDLKNPKKSIPIGTIMAIVTGLLVYLSLAVFLSFSVDSETLKSDNNILMKIAFFAPFVVAGVWGATLSSALGGILGGPRIMQALSIDKVTPKLFGKGVGKGKEPRNALILTFCLAELGILIGELDAIAEVVSMFYLAAYGFINLSALLESWASSDYRPTFKVPKWIAALGTIATFAVMFKLNAIAMIASLIVIGGIFLYLTRKQLSIGSGDVWQSVWSSIVKTGLKRMDQKELHKRNWEPNILLFTGSTPVRPQLIAFAKALAGRIGMISNFDLIENKEATVLFPKYKGEESKEDLKESGIFSRSMECRNVFKGIEAIASTYGFSGVEPNTVLMGWAKNTKDPIWFAGMTRTLSELDFNVLYLDYDKERGFGEKQHIDIWWRGINNNGELTLILLKFLLTSEDWNQARVRILMINEGDNYLKEFIERNVQKVLDEFRVSATIKVINNELEQKPLYDIMKVMSSNADLIMVDIPEFGPGEEAGFVKRTNELVDVIGTTLLVKASSHFGHTEDEIDIFKNSSENEDRSVIRKTFSATANAIPLPTDTELAGVVEQTHLVLTRCADKILNDQIILYTAAYKRLLLQLEQEASRCIKVQEEKWEITKQRYKHRLLLNSQMDFLNSAVKIVKNFEDDHLEIVKDNLALAVEEVISTADSLTLSVPKYVVRSLSDDDIQRQSDDNRRIRRIKWRKRNARKYSKKQASLRINFSRLIQYSIEQSFLKKFNQFLDDAGTSGQLLANLVWNYTSGISEDWQRIGRSNLETIKETELSKQINLRKKALETEILAEMDQIHNKFGSFLIQSNQEFSNALITDLQTIDINFIAEKRLNRLPRKKQLRKELKAYPDIWKRNQSLQLHYVMTDLHMLSINRALDLVSIQLTNRITQTLFEKPLETVQRLKEEVTRLKSELPSTETYQLNAFQLDAEQFIILNYDQIISRVIDTSKSLSELMPESMELMQEESINGFATGQRNDVDTNLLALENLTDHIIESKLIQVVQKEVDQIPEQLRKIFERIQHASRLIAFSFGTIEDDGIQEEQNLSEVLDRASLELEKVRDKLQELSQKSLKTVEDAVEDCQGHLSAHTIVHNAENLEQYIRQERNLKGFRHSLNAVKDRSKHYRQFITQLWKRKRSELAIINFETKNSEFENEHSLMRSFVERVSPPQKVMEDLPFYYRQLFIGKHMANTSSKENRTRELSLAQEAINRLHAGATGGILILGEPKSGKTFICERIVRRFNSGAVHRINPPLEGSIQVSHFDNTILKAMGIEGNLDNLLNDIPDKSVFLFNDLELWWERQNGGMEVLNRLGQIIEMHSHRLIFIVNMNVITFQLLEQVEHLSRHFLSTIRLSPLSSDQITEVLMTRHHSGGIPLELDGLDEHHMSEKKLRKLFSRYGSAAKGNVGMALQQWLGHITNASESKITVKWPDYQQLPEFRNTKWLVMLGQFVLHRHLTITKLMRLYPTSKESDLKDLLTSLKRSGLLEEKPIGVYSLSAYCYSQVILRLQSKQFIAQ